MAAVSLFLFVPGPGLARLYVLWFVIVLCVPLLLPTFTNGFVLGVHPHVELSVVSSPPQYWFVTETNISYLIGKRTCNGAWLVFALTTMSILLYYFFLYFNDSRTVDSIHHLTFTSYYFLFFSILFYYSLSFPILLNSFTIYLSYLLIFLFFSTYLFSCASKGPPSAILAMRLSHPLHGSLLPPGVCYTCDVCGKTLSTKLTLKRHKEQQHFQPLNSAVCALCHKVFRTLNSLNNHKSIYHRRQK